jgi:hypothetical protein
MFFELLCIVHVLVWLFVLTAFLNKTCAYYNVYYVIPLIYIIHILPFHIIITLKQKSDPENYKIHEEQVYEKLIIPKYFRTVTSMLEDFCFANPLGTQGMMIFGLLTSIFVLYPPPYMK